MDVIVFVKNEENNIVDNALQWCKENKIEFLKWRVIHSNNDFDRPIIYGFNFHFETEEDALAFKLRWG